MNLAALIYNKEQASFQDCHSLDIYKHDRELKSELPITNVASGRGVDSISELQCRQRPKQHAIDILLSH